MIRCIGNLRMYCLIVSKFRLKFKLINSLLLFLINARLLFDKNLLLCTYSLFFNYVLIFLFIPIDHLLFYQNASDITSVFL